MKKLLILITLAIISASAYAQNKKEQLVILSNRIDSLNLVVSTKNSDIVEKQNQMTKFEQELIGNKQKLSDAETQINNLKQDITLGNQKLANAVTQIQLLSQQIITLKNTQLKHDCSSAVGNSSGNYPTRINGNISGCISEGCDEIPSDLDLHASILMLDDDYNGDSVIDIRDLETAIVKKGDVNKDSKIDIYDIVYPEPLKYTVAVKNPNLLHDNGSIYNLIGIISSDGRSVLKVRLPIDLTDDNPGEGGNEGRVSEIDLWVSTNIVVYRNMTVVLRGKLLSGNSQSYRNNFAFQVDQIVGVVK